VGGEENHVLTVDEMPRHNHTCATIVGSGYLGLSQVDRAGWGNSGSTGGDQPHNNIPPTLSVIYWRRVS